MKNIFLTECYDQIIISDEDSPRSITPKQAEELDMMIKKKKLNENNVKWGRNTITFINYVGYINLKTFSIEILPKVSISNDPAVLRRSLLNMLKHSGFLKIKHSEMNRFHLFKDNLFEIFGRLYVEMLYKEVQRGLYSQYIYTEDNLSVLKGSLLLPQHISQNLSQNRRNKVYCGFDEYLHNNGLNQLFKITNALLLRKIRNIHTIKMLKQCELFLSDVDLPSFSKKEIELITVNRLNDRFEPCLILAKQFLTNMTSEFRGGTQNSFSILFEMEKLFELYIGNMIRKCTSFDVYTQHNQQRLFVNEKTENLVYQLKPDIVINDKTKQIIIDTKWKQVDSSAHRHGVKREDLFQLYAYVTRYEKAVSAILLYPYHESIKEFSGRKLESWYIQNNPHKKVRMYTVNLEDSHKTCDDLTHIINENIIYKKDSYPKSPQ